MDSPTIEFVGNILFDSPFSPADKLWKSFQEGLNNFVNQNGGISSVNTEVTNRVDWDMVNDVLKGNRPISDLGCN